MSALCACTLLGGLAASIACGSVLAQSSIADELKRRADQLLRDGIRSAPFPQTAPQSPITASAPPSLSGTWQSRHGMVYQLSQQGTSFTWTGQAWGSTQTAQGT